MSEENILEAPIALNVSASASRDDFATVVAIGVLAATLANFCHEALGHGLGCVAVGGHITLLTSIWFRCRGATALTDAGGPLGSLIVGAMAFAFLSLTGPTRPWRLFLVMFGAISLFWFAAQLIFHALLNHDDWYFVARQMGWPSVWRPIAATAGVIAFFTTIRLSSMALPSTGRPWLPPVRVAYVAAVVSAVIAGLMWPPAPIRSAIEGLLTLGVGPAGLLVAAGTADRNASPVAPAAPTGRSRVWIVASLLVFGTFIVVQARGLGSLAGIALAK